MRILIVGPGGRTGRHVIAALQARREAAELIGFSRSDPGIEGVAHRAGDLECAADRLRACEGIDTVIHYGPVFHPRETAMGTGMIDAAAAAGARRFIYISVIHPQIDDLLNHSAKLAVEAHLIDTAINWTILRPQHYMQNVDVPAVVRSGVLRMPYPATTTLGHVDMADVAEAVALTVFEPGHDHAAYDLAAGEHWSVDQLCAMLGEEAGVPISAGEITPQQLIDIVSAHHRLTAYEIEAFHRLFGYYARHGIRGNANVLGWLLGRAPTSFRAYARRRLAESGLIANG